MKKSYEQSYPLVCFLTSVRGIMLYTNRASGEVAGILDQLNPLVPKAKCM